MSGKQSQYSLGLDKTPANFVPLTPLSFLARTAAVYPDHISTVYEGRIVTLRIERYRYPDGEEVEREVIRHQGAVGIVAHDGTDLFLVRQPREVVGRPE